jgi:hypothetical protein
VRSTNASNPKSQIQNLKSIDPQVLQIHRAGRRPGCGLVALDPDLCQRGPNDVTHHGRVCGTEGRGNPDPPTFPEMFQRFDASL